MASFTDVFERKEIKYRLSARQHQFMRDALAGHMQPDEFGRTRITSLYFDTAERSLIDRSLEKPVYKEKLRLRWYGSVAADDRVFIEIKKKYQGIVYKRRVACSYAAARAYLGGMSYERACGRFPLPDALMAQESCAPRSLQIAHEIDQFIVRYQPLQPSMYIACDRTAYAPLGEGEGEDDLRITFDAGVAYRDLLFASTTNAVVSPVSADTRPLAALTSPVGAHASSGMPAFAPLMRAGEAIMEIKVAGPMPLWLVHALDACKAYPTSFSKYGEAYRRCAARAAHAPSARPRHYRAPSHAIKKEDRCA